jgi:magnesium transporter
MLKAYQLQQGQLVQLQHPYTPEQVKDAQWLELIAPTEEEWQTVQDICTSQLPRPNEINELEASSHHLASEIGFQVSCMFFHQLEGQPRNTNAAFVFDGLRLVSVCTREIPHFRLLHLHNSKGIKRLADPLAILMSLMEIKVNGLADEMEQAYLDLEKISQMVLGRHSDELEEAIDGLAEQEDLVGKVRLCIMDGQRDIRFLIRQPVVTRTYRTLCDEMLLDIETLLPHNSFLSEKTDFLLNATQGFINMEQNRIMKVFSVTALVFLPPTLIAGIYGMNFQHMPELNWWWSYPLVLGLMVLAGVGPYCYFKLKGWL